MAKDEPSIHTGGVTLAFRRRVGPSATDSRVLYRFQLTGGSNFDGRVVMKLSIQDAAKELKEQCRIVFRGVDIELWLKRGVRPRDFTPRMFLQEVALSKHWRILPDPKGAAGASSAEEWPHEVDKAEAFANIRHPRPRVSLSYPGRSAPLRI